jgi:hypothetical protein
MVPYQAPGLLAEQCEEFGPLLLFLSLVSLLDVENCSCPRVLPENAAIVGGPPSVRMKCLRAQESDSSGASENRSCIEQRKWFLLISFPQPSSSRITRSVPVPPTLFFIRMLLQANGVAL